MGVCRIAAAFKLLITNQCRLCQAVAAAKKGVGPKATQRCSDLLYGRAEEPGSCLNDLSGRENSAETIDSALAPRIGGWASD
jgi:hypothetical protein